MAQRSRNKNSIGCLFWIALILLVLVIFLFNRETIQNVLEETGFLNILKDENIVPDVERVLPGNEDENVPEEVELVPAEPAAEEQLPAPAEPEEETVSISLEEPETASDQPEEQAPPPEKPQKVRRSKLYFIQVQEDDGNISLKEIVRPVYYIDSPLTETINTLLEGLSASELNMNLISLIPDNTKLLSISVKGSTAYLNFSDSFRFNSFGVEGYKAQLKQIIYTATDFANIDSVQILIEGAVNEYMGPEGVYIGKPLGRGDL